jgi:hypothetical protein
MNFARLLAVAAATACACAAAADNPFEGFKGKMKEGLYDYKMELDLGNIPGMPPGMGKQNMAFQQCVTNQDIEKGQMGRSKESQMPTDCKVSDFKMSGNTATYKMDCKGEPSIKGDSRVTFAGDSFTMDMKMAMNQAGQVMNVTQKMNARYVGPCKK